MKSVRLFVFVAAFAASSSAHAGTYFRVAGLYSAPGDIQVANSTAFKTSLKSNLGFSGALGYKFTLVRAELDLQYFHHSFGSGSTNIGGVATSGGYKQFNAFVNAYVDVPVFLGLAAYIGAGIGQTRIDVSNLAGLQGSTSVGQYSGSANSLGYQAMVGLQFHLPGEATIHAGYRFQYKDDIELLNAVGNVVQSAALGNNRIFELGLSIGF